MNNKIPWLTVCASVALTLTSLIVTLPMTQENPEKLFLRDQQLRDFELYSKKIEEREIVVGLVKVKQSLFQNLQFSDDLTNQLTEVLSDEQVTVHSFRSLYGKLFGSIQDQTQLVAKVSTIIRQVKLLPLLGHEYVAHLFVLVPNLSLNDKDAIIKNIKTIYAKHPHQYFLSGLSIINQGLNAESNQIKNRLFPIMFVMCFFLLWWMTGKLMPTLAVFIPALMASGLTLLSIQIFFGSMNMINSVLPLFTFAINASLGLHLLFSFSDMSEDFIKMLKLKAIPITLMIGTTFIGLVSLVVSDLVIIRHFALLAGGLVIITGLTHLIFAWAFYSLFPSIGQARPLHFFQRWRDLLPPTRPTFWALTLITIIGTLCIPFIRLETEAAHYFNQETHPIGQGMREIGSTIFGNPNMEIILEKKSGEWELPDLEKIHQLESALLASLGNTYKILSPNQFLLEANGLSGVGMILPTSLLSYPILLGQILGETYTTYYKNNLYRLTLMGPILSALEFETFDKAVAKIVSTQMTGSEISYQFTGTAYHLKRSQLNLVSILGMSFLSSLIIITLAAFLFNRNMLKTLIFFAVNLFPLLATCLFIKIFNLSFNIATVMTFSIALGLVVDGTFHLQHAHEHLPPEQIWFKVKYPVWASTLVLSLSFGVLAINSFLPIREFALVLVFSIFLGMIFDLYFLDAAVKLFSRTNRAPKD
ncbi:MAG: hypothetical protein HYV97_06825 [Bdellovibrio sp.]|nr:hypothetical protein [Bdellovibrio sp.]